MKFKTAAVAAIAMGLAGCNDAKIASKNISRASDNFEVVRRIVFYNSILGEYMLNVEGLCSIEPGPLRTSVTCKVGEGQYKKHYLGNADNVLYFAEQINAANVSPFHYRVIFKPQAILPDMEIRTSVGSVGADPAGG